MPVNLFFPLCPGRSLPLLCVSRARFAPGSFFSPILSDLWPWSSPEVSYHEEQTPSLSLLLRNRAFFSFLHPQHWHKETESEHTERLLAHCWNYPGRLCKEKPFNYVSKLFSTAGKSHLGFFKSYCFFEGRKTDAFVLVELGTCT